jgi:hypothetical protein
VRKEKKNMGPSDTLSQAAVVALIEAFTHCSTSYEKDRSGLEFKTPLFDFVRHCRAIPELASLPSLRALEVVTAVMNEHGLEFSAFDELSNEDGELEFLDTWDTVLLPVGSDRIKEARRLADALEGDLNLPSSVPPKMVTFLKLAFCLQRLASTSSVALPVERLAKELNVSAMMVSRMRKIASRHGWLTQTRAHSHRHKLAAYFRVNLPVEEAPTERGVLETEECPF